MPASTLRLLTTFALTLPLVTWAADGVYKVELLSGQTVYTDVAPVPGTVKSAEKVANAPPAPELSGQVGQAARKYPVTLFTAGNCKQCDNARSYLKQRGIPFAEKIVTTELDAQLYKPLAGDELGVPLMKIGSDKIGPGFNQGAWQTILDAAGYPEKSQLPANYDYGIPKPLAEIRAQATAASGATSTPSPTRGVIFPPASSPPAITFTPLPPPPPVRF